MQEVKMVTATFQGGWGEDICDELKIFVKEKDDYSRKSYWCRPESKKSMTEDQWKEFIETEEFAKMSYYGAQAVTMQYEDFIDVKFAMKDESRLRSDSVFKIKVSPPQVDLFNMIEAHTALMNKQFEQLSKFSSHQFNEKCNVPNYDTSMQLINQILLLEDCCSDYLQQALKRGWRIIAVSPQPDQRRPDYILGRHSDNPTEDALRTLDYNQGEIGL